MNKKYRKGKNGIGPLADTQQEKFIYFGNDKPYSIWRICLNCYVATEYPYDFDPPIRCRGCNELYQKNGFKDIYHNNDVF